MRHFFGALALLCLAGAATAQSYEEMARARDLLVGDDPAAALEVIVPAAEAGHLRAMNLLGAAYQHGIGVERDGVRARELFEAAAAQNYPPAVYNLGALFDGGAPGVERDGERAVEHYLEAVELDYHPAMGSMVEILMEAPGTEEENAARAMVYAERGAFLGDATSANWLAGFRYHGIGGPQDHEEARRLYLLAAALGKPDAMTAYGGMLMGGDGGPRDESGALDWYEAAAAAGDPDGAIQLAEWLGNAAATQEESVVAMARCLQGLELAGDAALPSWRTMCDEIRSGLSEAQVRRAGKMADQF